MKKEKYAQKYFWILLFCSFLLIFLSRFEFIKNLSGNLGDLFTPSQRVVYQTWKKFFSEIKHFSYWKSGAEKIKNLEERNRELLVAYSQKKILEKENKFLRDQLKVLPRGEKKMIMARVAAHKKGLLIDKGKMDGIAKEDLVVYKGFLVGIVESVNLQSAKIKLPYHPDFKILAYDIETSVSGEVRGDLSGSIVFDKISIKEKINLGDLIAVSKESYLTDFDLIIGRVVEINKKESEIFQSAVLEEPVKYPDLEYVFVLKK